VKQVHLANALGIDPDKVSKSLDRKGTRTFTEDEMRVVRQMLREDGDPVEAEDYPLLPIIGQVQAGQWREAIHQPRGHMSSPTHNTPRRTFALEVVGDSMDKLALPGARIMVDPDDKSLFPGKLYVVINADGETTFKQFHADPARLVPCSSNPAHAVIELGGEEPFTIVGRVIGSYQPF
jgi:SOS-response transcriptional repressor LexA